MTRRVVTAADVARLVGVSPSAVSRAFTPGASVSATTRDRIMAAARALGYRPNAIARGLITRRTGMVALVVGDTRNPYNSTILESATRQFQAAGRRVMLFLAAPGEEPGEALSNALRYQVEGVLVSVPLLSSAMAGHHAGGGAPIVLLNRTVEGHDLPLVKVDNAGGARRMADFLVDGGHRRIAFMNGVVASTTNGERRAAFLARLAERGLPAPIEDTGHYTYEGGYLAAHRLLARDDRPEAIFCANDVMALGALDLARHHLGLRVPDEVSIVGFDDIPDSARPGIELTTIHTDPAEVARRGAAILIELIETGAIATPATPIPARLVIRRSART